jgi:hypothetical protein
MADGGTAGEGEQRQRQHRRDCQQHHLGDPVGGAERL